MTLLWLIVWAIEGFPNFLNHHPAGNHDTQWLIAGIVCLVLDIVGRG
jgi:hypothetical protein